jgi:hypothetical protein
MQFSYESYYVPYTIDTINYDKEKIKTKLCNQNNTTYKILNNDSSYITFDNDSLRNYRSIILGENGNILCFSPPNSIELDYFIKKYPQIDDNIYANEIIEGTMINLFYDNNINSWEISTRGAVGGNYWYYRTQYSMDPTEEEIPSQKTFKNMFMEVFRQNENENNLNSISFLEYLPKNYCYSFVLQHPDNHIVLPIERPSLYLVSVYELNNTEVKFVPQTIYECWSCFLNINGIIEFPKRYESTYYDDLKQQFCSIQSDYHSMGIMFTNLTTGERSCMSNPVYEEVKKLRGNNPNLQYQFFCLSRIEQKSTFLTYFPMYTNIFIQFEKQYQDFITNVHQSYYSYYVKKEGIPISKKFFIHASKIHHQIYLPSLNEGRKIISRKVVKEYFDAMKPSEIIFYLNYEKRMIALEKQQKKEDVNENTEYPEIVVL